MNKKQPWQRHARKPKPKIRTNTKPWERNHVKPAWKERDQAVNDDGTMIPLIFQCTEAPNAGLLRILNKGK